MGDVFANIELGFNVAFSFKGLLYCFIGVTLGTFIGVLPGIGPLAAISLLMPLTFKLDPTIAIIMLAGIYYGAAYGGSTASILLNLPGTASGAVACLDGYPMAKQGRAGIALFTTAMASFVGSLIGTVTLALFAPLLAVAALRFGSQEYFSLMLLGLLAAAILSSGSPFRSLAMVALGLILGTVGMDTNSAQTRFTFGIAEFHEGLPLVAIALGLFGIPEVIANAGRKRPPGLRAKDVPLRSMIPTREDVRRSWKPILRGSALGTFFGTLPGTSGTVASFASYAVEKKLHKDPSQFGKGAIEGVAAPEAANNASAQTDFIPTLTLGIPSEPVMALMLGVLLIHGVTPGPQMIADKPDLFWGLVISFLIGNVMLLILNIPLIGIWVRVLAIPNVILYPSIVALVCVGVYTVGFSVIDLFVVMAFGLLGYGMLLLRFEPAPLVLGLVLGPMMEENLRRSLVLSRGDPMTFVENPLSAVFIGLSAALVCWLIYSEIRRRRRASASAVQPISSC